MDSNIKFNPTKYKNDFQRDNYDRIVVLVPKGEKEKFKAYAVEQKKSLNAFILESVKKNMEL